MTAVPLARTLQCSPTIMRFMVVVVEKRTPTTEVAPAARAVASRRCVAFSVHSFSRD